MTVLFLDQFAEIAGAQRSLLDVMPAVLELGWRALAMTPEGPLAAELRGRGVPVLTIRCGPYGFGSKSARDVLRFAGSLPGLARLIAAQRADLIYVNGPRVLPGAALASRGRVPVLFHCHSRVSKGYATRLVRTSLGLAGATVVASSKFVAEPLGTAGVEVVYNGVQPTRTRLGPFPAGGAWRIGVIGRIAPQKGQAEFLEAARLLLSEGHEYRFVVCGEPMFAPPGYADRVRALARGLPVEFVDWSDDVGSVLAGLDLLVVPSFPPESTTRVIPEAFAAGVPVVAFPSGGIPEIVEHGRTGFLTETQTPEALARILRDLTTGPTERLASAADAARNEWRKRFTVAAFRDRIGDVMRQALDRSRAAGRGTGRRQARQRPLPLQEPPGTRSE